MSSTAIKFENISKQYRLGVVSTRTLSHDLNRWWNMNILRKEDPYLKIGDVNDRSKKAESEYVWALRDIDFEVKQGDVLGIIGKNGAGKSTLLKILSRVTSPTTGAIKAQGRIASLLEVGTGFHPEMTGRENIYLNGSIMGMNKQEITRKLDEIVDFSGVERYLDTPTKRYSSGMTVRLGFAIAAHLEPEILVVDEVLAVGDVEFQKKAIGKMQDVAQGEGRTVLFVSHNMGAVKSLCNKGVVLKDGTVSFIGTVNDAVEVYLGSNSDDAGIVYENPKPKETDITRIEIVDAAGSKKDIFDFYEDIHINFDINIEKRYLEELSIAFRVKDQLERNIFSSDILVGSIVKEAGRHRLSVKIPSAFMVPNTYTLAMVALHIPNKEVVANIESPVRFVIEETGTQFYKYAGNDYGCVFMDCNWKTITK